MAQLYDANLTIAQFKALKKVEKINFRPGKKEGTNNPAFYNTKEGVPTTTRVIYMEDSAGNTLGKVSEKVARELWAGNKAVLDSCAIGMKQGALKDGSDGFTMYARNTEDILMSI